MKKLLLSLFTLGIFTASNAQKFEVNVGYGTPSMYSFSYGIAEAIGHALIGIDVSPSSLGTFNAAFLMKSDSENWRYGAEVTNEFFDTTDKIKSQNILSIMPRLDYVWLNPTGKFRLYSGAAAGITIVSAKYQQNVEETDWSETNFAFNVTPIGFRYGGDLAIFVETNIGMKGFAQAGISYSF